MTTRKVSILTLGCAKNQNDTDNLAGLLKKRGYEIELEPAKSDAIVVHTCSFIEAAKKESIQTIMEAGQIKGNKKKLIVTGCMVQQHGKEMLEELPEVDAFLGTGQLAQVPDILEKPRPRFLNRMNPGGLMDPDLSRVFPKNGVTANLRLSEGCSHPCSFCVIPKLRGGLQSRTEEAISNEARSLVDQGVEELVIIGQDTGDWGRDNYKEKRLPQLLRKLGGFNGIRWIRLMYMHPASFSDELIDVFAESPEKFPYLDMPIQHIDQAMLMDMDRLLGEKDLRNLVDKIHKRLPRLSLRTTLIVGHPGETDHRFEKLLEFVREGHFHHLGSFAYSREEGTPSALKPNQVPEAIKKDRQSAIHEAQFDVAHKKAQKRLGSVESILLEEIEGEWVLGRSRMEAPEIDGVIRLPQKAARQKTCPQIGRRSGTQARLRRFINAKLTGYDTFEYTARPI